ncbi:MAG: methylase involved in ubiquinone/menaquinone biosynthesis [Chitinophagaceae bacterium]|nr:methylase involved in ubiquinone/menaquinone biosynthesis [Chitinophagaceae bacterium]
MKDLFSHQAEQYQQFRPTYPQELYEFLITCVPENKTAWDCGTGNGQVAGELAHYFKQVYATDISTKQLEQAVQLPNILYKVEAAENTSFLSHHFDLITVAQAIHWFDFSSFYKEVERTLKPDGILAVMGYALLSVDQKTDAVIDRFYHDIIGAYWDKERKYIDELYQTIPFPFQELQTPTFFQRENWSLEQFIGYLGTWSAVQRYIEEKGHNPLALIEEDLLRVWKKGESKTVTFPILLRVGKTE